MAGRRGDPIRTLYAGPAGRLTQRNTLYKRLSSPLRGAIFLPLRSTPFPFRPSEARKMRRIFTISPRCARSYPRHACPLCVVVFMHLHDISKTTPELASLAINDPQTIMHFHAQHCSSSLWLVPVLIFA